MHKPRLFHDNTGIQRNKATSGMIGKIDTVLQLLPCKGIRLISIQLFT